MAAAAVEGWVDFVQSQNRAQLRTLLHPDVVFESPVVHSPQRGADLTWQYLIAAERVLGGEGFRFVGRWDNDRGAVLEFVNEIDGISVNGVDIITTTHDGESIIGFKVMIRPLKAIELIQRKMMEQMAAAAPAGG